MKMKKILNTLFLVLGFGTAFCQVGIGTVNPDASAALDIDVSNLPAYAKKGLLLPRVSLLSNTDIVTIPNPAAGIVVYNLNDSGTGMNSVTKDTFYFWNGVKWIDFITLTTVKNELLPQVFSIVNTHSQITTGAISSADGVVVTFEAPGIVLNTGNNITFNSPDNTFRINKTGSYEISGSLNYNPYAQSSGVPTDLEFIIQVSSDNGVTWGNIAKSTSVWDSYTRGNSRTMIVSPIVVTLSGNNLIRCVAKSNYGVHGEVEDSKIYAGTGITYSRALKIQYLN